MRNVPPPIRPSVIMSIFCGPAVTEVGEDDAADGAGGEADGVGAEGEQDAREGAYVREELAVQDDGGGDSIDVEVVPFDTTAQHGRNEGVAAHLRIDSGWRCGYHGGATEVLQVQMYTYTLVSHAGLLAWPWALEVAHQ